MQHLGATYLLRLYCFLFNVPTYKGLHLYKANRLGGSLSMLEFGGFMFCYYSDTNINLTYLIKHYKDVRLRY